MNKSELKIKVMGIVRTAMQHGFNRSMIALEDARAIDRTKMNEHYCGVGTKYYDLVTKQFEYTEKQLEPIIDEIIESLDSDQT